MRKGNKKSALSGAIKDIESEIKNLSMEKRALKSSLDKVSSAMEIDHELEKQLQKKIAGLIEKEAKLNQKKKKLQTDIERVSDKVNKIAKIRSEISDI